MSNEEAKGEVEFDWRETLRYLIQNALQSPSYDDRKGALLEDHIERLESRVYVEKQFRNSSERIHEKAEVRKKEVLVSVVQWVDRIPSAISIWSDESEWIEDLCARAESEKVRIVLRPIDKLLAPLSSNAKAREYLVVMIADEKDEVEFDRFGGDLWVLVKLRSWSPGPVRSQDARMCGTFDVCDDSLYGERK